MSDNYSGSSTYYEIHSGIHEAEEKLIDEHHEVLDYSSKQKNGIHSKLRQRREDIVKKKDESWVQNTKNMVDSGIEKVSGWFGSDSVAKGSTFNNKNSLFK